MNSIEATLQLAQAIQRLAQAINRYVDQQEEPSPKAAKAAIVSSATYDRQTSQAEKEMRERFGAQGLPQSTNRA